ncbi:MAG: hypothetical protein AAGI68_03105 [Planctomycetota bacterium]
MPLALWLLFGFLAFAFARTVLAVVGCRLHIHTARHDLIVETKAKRIEYLRDLAIREIETLRAHGVDTETDEPPATQGADEADEGEAQGETAPIATLTPEPEPALQQAA